MTGAVRKVAESLTVLLRRAVAAEAYGEREKAVSGAVRAKRFNSHGSAAGLFPCRKLPKEVGRAFCEFVAEIFQNGDGWNGLPAG